MTNTSRMTLLLAVAGCLFGGFFAIEEWFFHSSFKTNDSMIWTLPLITYIFLALMSTGASILLALAEILDDDWLKQNKRQLLLTAIALLLGAFTALATEMGSPFSIIWLVLSPNVMSPIWWMGTLYSIELVLLLLKFLAEWKGIHLAKGSVLAWSTLIIACLASLTLGSVFGTVVARAAFSGAQSALFTLVCAMVSGVSIIGLLQVTRAFNPRLWGIWRLAVIAQIILLSVLWVYSIRNSGVGNGMWVQGWLPLGFIIALALSFMNVKVAMLVTLLWSFLAEVAFVTCGQLVSLGPKSTWFGAVQHYVPNLAEIGILILGISMAALLFQLMGLFINTRSSIAK